MFQDFLHRSFERKTSEKCEFQDSKTAGRFRHIFGRICEAENVEKSDIIDFLIVGIFSKFQAQKV